MSKIPHKGEPFFIENGFIKEMDEETGHIELVADLMAGQVGNYEDRCSPGEKIKNNRIIRLLNLGIRADDQV